MADTYFDPFAVTHYPTIRPSRVVKGSVERLLATGKGNQYPQYEEVTFENLYQYLLPEFRRDPAIDRMLNFLGVHPMVVIQPMVTELTATCDLRRCCVR